MYTRSNLHEHSLKLQSNMTVFLINAMRYKYSYIIFMLSNCKPYYANVFYESKTSTNMQNDLKAHKHDTILMFAVIFIRNTQEKVIGKKMQQRC